MEGTTSIITTVLANVGDVIGGGIDVITTNPLLAAFLGCSVVITGMKVFKAARKSSKG